MGEKSCEHRTILLSNIGTATGVAMPKKFATSRRRQESASDGCKIVRSVSIFCSNYPGLPIADASQMICDRAITFSDIMNMLFSV